jgi:hypothetical protein
MLQGQIGTEPGSAVPSEPERFQEASPFQMVAGLNASPARVDGAALSSPYPPGENWKCRLNEWLFETRNPPLIAENDFSTITEETQDGPVHTVTLVVKGKKYVAEGWPGQEQLELEQAAAEEAFLKLSGGVSVGDSAGTPAPAVADRTSQSSGLTFQVLFRVSASMVVSSAGQSRDDV